jgi:hypothetical protein
MTWYYRHLPAGARSFLGFPELEATEHLTHAAHGWLERLRARQPELSLRDSHLHLRERVVEELHRVLNRHEWQSGQETAEEVARRLKNIHEDGRRCSEETLDSVLLHINALRNREAYGRERAEQLFELKNDNVPWPSRFGVRSNAVGKELTESRYDAKEFSVKLRLAAARAYLPHHLRNTVLSWTDSSGIIRKGVLTRRAVDDMPDVELLRLLRQTACDTDKRDLDLTDLGSDPGSEQSKEVAVRHRDDQSKDDGQESMSGRSRNSASVSSDDDSSDSGDDSRRTKRSKKSIIISSAGDFKVLVPAILLSNGTDLVDYFRKNVATVWPDKILAFKARHGRISSIHNIMAPPIVQWLAAKLEARVRAEGPTKWPEFYKIDSYAQPTENRVAPRIRNVEARLITFRWDDVTSADSGWRCLQRLFPPFETSSLSEKRIAEIKGALARLPLGVPRDAKSADSMLRAVEVAFAKTASDVNDNLHIFSVADSQQFGQQLYTRLNKITTDDHVDEGDRKWANKMLGNLRDPNNGFFKAHDFRDQVTGKVYNYPSLYALCLWHKHICEGQYKAWKEQQEYAPFSAPAKSPNPRQSSFDRSGLSKRTREDRDRQETRDRGSTPSRHTTAAAATSTNAPCKHCGRVYSSNQTRGFHTAATCPFVSHDKSIAPTGRHHPGANMTGGDWLSSRSYQALQHMKDPRGRPYQVLQYGKDARQQNGEWVWVNTNDGPAIVIV